MPSESLAPLLHYLRKLTAPAGADVPDAELLSRFRLHRDEGAFTALVRRHGPMVLAVCRRVVRDGHAAEDAFQATFLVLARKAGSLARPELLANWLYGVAYRTAAKAKTEVVKRRAHERAAVRVPKADPGAEFEWQDVRAVLDDEVNRLPQRYRVPVVLCYLQGQTNAEAARRLGCSRGTVATLLARARHKLRRRLTQRGVALSAGFGLTALMPMVRGGTVPLALEQGTVKAATLLAAGHMEAAGALAAQAVSLAKGVSKGMLMQKLKIPVAILMMTALVGAGAGVSAYRAGAHESETTPSDTEAKPQPTEAKPRPTSPSGRLVQPTLRPSPAPADAVATQLKEQLPAGPSPIPVVVGLDAEGCLCVFQKVTYYQPETETLTLKNGQKHRVTYYTEKHSVHAKVYELQQVQVHDTKGREVKKQELRKRLKKEMLALISANGQPIDPLHLRLYKDDTLVFVLPPPTAPAVPGVVPTAPQPAPAVAYPPAYVPLPAPAEPVGVPGVVVPPPGP